LASDFERDAVCLGRPGTGSHAERDSSSVRTSPVDCPCSPRPHEPRSCHDNGGSATRANPFRFQGLLHQDSSIKDPGCRTASLLDGAWQYALFMESSERPGSRCVRSRGPRCENGVLPRLARISHGSLGLRKTRRRNQFFQVAMMSDDFYEVITEPSGRRKYFKRRKEIYFFVIRPLEGTAPQALRAEVSIFSTALRRPSVQRRRFVHTC
jgi:hypothetical protein